MTATEHKDTNRRPTYTPKFVPNSAKENSLNLSRINENEMSTNERQNRKQNKNRKQTQRMQFRKNTTERKSQEKTTTTKHTIPKAYDRRKIIRKIIMNWKLRNLPLSFFLSSNEQILAKKIDKKKKKNRKTRQHSAVNLRSWKNKWLKLEIFQP